MGKLSKVKRIQLNCSIRQLKEYCDAQRECSECVFCNMFPTEAVCTLRGTPASWKEIEEQKGEPTI